MPVDDYYVGVDLGQKKDYTVVAVILKRNRDFFLTHLKQFPLGTDYTQVLDYLQRVAEHFQKVRGFFIDPTGVGDVFVEIARKHNIRNVQGVVLTMPKKQEVMTCLRQMMEEKRLHFPRDNALASQMGDQMAELTAATSRNPNYVGPSFQLATPLQTKSQQVHSETRRPCRSRRPRPALVLVLPQTSTHTPTRMRETTKLGGARTE